MRLPRPTVLLPLAVLALAACDDDVAGPDDIHPSVLIDELTSGEPEVEGSFVDGRLVVAITTYRNGCADPAGEDVDIDLSSRTLTIRPYDRWLDLVCFPEPAPEVRRVSALVLRSGTWSVIVHGSRLADPIDPADPYEPVTLDISVDVP